MNNTTGFFAVVPLFETSFKCIETQLMANSLYSIEILKVVIKCVPELKVSLLIKET